MTQTLEIVLVIIIPAIISISPTVVSAIVARKSKAKQVAEAKSEDATAADKISGSYQKIVDDLQEQIDKTNERQSKMETKLDRQGRRIRYLEQGVHILTNQVRSLGVEPAFSLEEEKE